MKAKLLVAALAAAALALPAQAHAAPRVALNNCGTYNWSAHTPAASWIQVDWETSPCGDKISAEDIDVHGVIHTSGWVTSLELNTRASSPAAMQTGFVRAEHADGTGRICKELWPSTGSWFAC